MHLPENQLITISEMHEIISPRGRYHAYNGHMASNSALCGWGSEPQDKLCIVHQDFELYLSV
jgi:hypothetical protein